MHRRTLRVASGIAAAALLVGACSDDDPTTETPDVSEPEGSEPAGDSGSPAAAGDLDPAFVAAVEERCAQTNEEITAVEESNPDETPEAAIAFVTGFADAMQGFVDDTGPMASTPEEEAVLMDLHAALGDAIAAFRDAAAQIEGGSDDIESAVGPAFNALGAPDAIAGEQLGFSLQTCGEEPVVPAEGAAIVDVTATDYAFDIPEVRAGQTAFVMANEGEEPHFMYVVRLKEAGTLDEALAAEAAGEDPEAFIEEEIGDSLDAPPGGSAVINVEDLTPGSYAMLCFVTTPDGESHADLGMAQEFEVTS